MERLLRYVVCPEAAAEFRELLEGTREQVRELGSFETLFWMVCEKGPRELEAKPMGPYGSADLYVINGRYVVVWIAVCKSKRAAAVVKWMRVSTDVLAQQEAVAAAVDRAEHLFPEAP
jgi:hypothetical protein